MTTRRDVLLGAIAASSLTRAGPAFAEPSQPSTPVGFSIPAGACDCHTHIHGDPASFPWFEGRVYTPELASPEQMKALHRALQMQRVVIVTPSVYGTDNSATLFGMQARGKDARGVAVIGPGNPDAELDQMERAGIRGVRVNLATGGVNDPEEAKRRFNAAVDRVKGRGWHVQVYTNASMIPLIKETFVASPVTVVFDHFGGVQAAEGLRQPGFPELIELVRTGKAYVKISGAYRASTLAPEYGNVVPFARALIAANPDRILWGSDWPHPDSVTPPGRKTTEVTPLLRIDDGKLLNQLAVWEPDAAVRNRILVDNPARLYKF